MLKNLLAILLARTLPNRPKYTEFVQTGQLNSLIPQPSLFSSRFEDRDDHRTACASVLIFNDVAYQTFSVSHTHPPMRLRVEKAVALRNSDNYSRRGTVVESALNAL